MYEIDKIEEEEIIKNDQKDEKNVHENYIKNQQILKYLKDSVERDVRGLEKLVLNLRLKDSTLHDTIQNQILEINRLMDIIRLEPEINQKGRNLLL